MSDKRDYYEVLGVSRDVDERTLKKAYRALAHQHHPDKNPGDTAAEEKFKEASEAYAILSDGEKRARYDRFGHAGMGGDAGGAGFGVNIQDIFGDLFGDLFGGGGGGGRRRGAARGADLRYHLEVKFEDAAFGIEKEIVVPRLENCGTCAGSGAKSGTQPAACGTCGGVGEIRVSQGFFSIARTCHVCGGSGRVVKDPCDDCEGRGQIELEREMTVKIPPGVGEGTRLRLVGEGEAGRGGGPRGDLYVVLTIEQHPLFTREDDSVLCDVPLSFVQATLGTSIEVPTLDGRVKLKVPSGTQPGTVFRLRGKGIPHLRASTRGDQLVTVQVEVPRALNDEQKSLLEKFAEISGEDVHPEHKSFFDKVKELFD